VTDKVNPSKHKVIDRCLWFICSFDMSFVAS